MSHRTYIHSSRISRCSVNFYAHTYFQIEVGSADISGTAISADQHIFVTSGVTQTAVFGSAKDYIVATIPPMNKLGVDYVFGAFSKSGSGDAVKITS